LVFLIECLLNQNARDLGAADSPAVTRKVLDLLADADIGMVQIPCPEIACLGFERQRPSGKSLRQALEVSKSATCCQHLAMVTADRIQCYLDQGFKVLAVLGGNEQSPGCAVHTTAAEETQLTDRSGVFMRALAAELAHRGLRIQFRGMRDTDSVLLDEDLDWLRERLF
jgi:predicted secreted protein